MLPGRRSDVSPGDIESHHPGDRGPQVEARDLLLGAHRGNAFVKKRKRVPRPVRAHRIRRGEQLDAARHAGTARKADELAKKAEGRPGIR